jgi:hypothetical protein
LPLCFSKANKSENWCSKFFKKAIPPLQSLLNTQRSKYFQVFLKKCLVCLFSAFFQALLEGRVQRVAAVCNATLMHNIIQSLGMAGRFCPLHTQRTDTAESGVRSGGWGSRDAAAQTAVSQYVPLSEVEFTNLFLTKDSR